MYSAHRLSVRLFVPQARPRRQRRTPHYLMANKRRKRSVSPAPPSESRAAEALTVGWLLAVMTTFLCELGSVGALALGSLSSEMSVAAAYLLFAALVMGIASLALTLGVLQVRRVPPPRGVTVVSLIIGIAPLLVLLAEWLR